MVMTLIAGAIALVAIWVLVASIAATAVGRAFDRGQALPDVFIPTPRAQGGAVGEMFAASQVEVG